MCDLLAGSRGSGPLSRGGQDSEPQRSQKQEEYGVFRGQGGGTGELVGAQDKRLSPVNPQTPSHMVKVELSIHIL